MQIATYEDAVRLSRRTEQTGGGYYSNVYADPEDAGVVHKISKTNDPAYRHFVEDVVLPRQSSPFVPRIYDYKKWRTRGERYRHYAKMEALRPIFDAPLILQQRATDLIVLADAENSSIEDTLRYFARGPLDITWRGGKIEAVRRRVKKEQPGALSILAAIQQVREEYGHSNDLHDKNVMWREAADEIVITDPLCD